MEYNQIKSCFKKVAGLNARFNYCEGKASGILIDELSLYPDVNESEKEDITFCFFKPAEIEVTSNNPSAYYHCTNGFGLNLGGYSIFWLFDTNKDIPCVYFYLNISDTRLYHKLRGMQFTHPYEEIGQIFHDGILQPTLLMFFNKNTALIHGSTVVSEEGESYVFGGTGGVGKTSLELELIFSRNFHFLADDISFLDKNGYLHPNYNHPKIYGYNLENSPLLKRKLLSDRTLWDRAWWFVQSFLKKPNKFRRRANLKQFYNQKISGPCQINNYVVLSRTNTAEPSIREISCEQAALLNSAVIYTEFSSTFNLAKYQYFNSTLTRNVPYIDFEDIMRHTMSSLVSGLKNANCFILDIPISYKADSVKNTIPKLLNL